MNGSEIDNRQKKIKAIRRAANTGLYGSLLFVVLTIVEHYLAQYVWIHEITASDYTHRLFLMVGLVLAVADIALVLFALRRQLPRVRQLDSVDERLERYAALVRSVYCTTMAVVFVLCAIIVTTKENTLIMLLLLMVVMLMLAYPNMYKMKADMGLTDDEMKELFGDKFLA